MFSEVEVRAVLTTDIYSLKFNTVDINREFEKLWLAFPFAPTPASFPVFRLDTS